jgi:hypothetical protein
MTSWQSPSPEIETAVRDILTEDAGHLPGAPEGLAARARAGLRRQRRRTTLLAAATALALAAPVSLAWQSLTRPDPAPVAATPSVDPHCHEPLQGYTKQLRPLPPGRVAVEVLRCAQDIREYQGHQWTFLIQSRANTGLDGVNAALRTPDRPAGEGVTCPASGHAVDPIWLKLDDGNWLAPQWPRAGCESINIVQDVFRDTPFSQELEKPLVRLPDPGPTKG